LSFSLWFLGEHIIKWRSQKKECEMMYKEVCDEAQLNIIALNTELECVQKALVDVRDIPVFIPRLLTTATIYAITSGNVRFINSRKRQLALCLLNRLYESYNQFIENTEQLFTILLLREDGLTWVHYRLERYCKHISQNITSLNKYLDEFEHN
jgi:hypothetical protein